MHVHVLLLPVVEVVPLLPADLPAQQEAVCKREGDVRDQDEQQVEGKHRGITEALVKQRLRERKENNLGYPRFGLPTTTKGETSNVQEMRACQRCVLLLTTMIHPTQFKHILFSNTLRFPTAMTDIWFRTIEPI